MKQWAIAIGINQYQCFQPLSFAQRDAQALRNVLVDEAGFPPEQCLLMTDTSPPVWGKPTYPSRENIQGWIDLLAQQYLQPGDVLWYFFSGYGVCYQGQDYLVPIEGNPRTLPDSSIPFETLFQSLQAMPTERKLVLLDMSRSQSVLSHEPVGMQTEQIASDTGIPTILSCQPGQFSRETAALGHGFFTAALLEGVRSFQTATLEGLDQYLRDRLPELSEHYWRPIQQPRIVSPPDKIRQVILPGLANAEASSSQLPADRPVSSSESIQASNTAGQTMGSNTSAQHHDDGIPQIPPPSLPATSAAIEPTTADIPDEQFWRRMLLWGGLAAGILLMGVLLRHWKAINPQPVAQTSPQPAAKPSSAPVRSPSTAIAPTAAQPNSTQATAAVTPTANPQTNRPGSGTQPPALKPVTGSTGQPAPSSSTASQLSLATARAKAIAPNAQANPLREAIGEASQIPPGHPQYQEAQQEIAVWSRNILDIAKQHAGRKDFVSAIRAASWVPSNQSIAGEARQAIDQWCPAVVGVPATTQDLLQAKTICLKQK